MTREEEIRKAIDKTFPCTNGGRCYEQSLGASGFELGVKWADEHPNLERLWHDASEEPQGAYIILCDVLDNRQWIVERFYIDMAYATWKDFAETISVRRWAYISDLLPKGGEK